MAKTFEFHVVMGSHRDSVTQTLIIHHQNTRWESIRIKLTDSAGNEIQSISVTPLPAQPVTMSTSQKPSRLTWAKYMGSKLTGAESSRSSSSAATALSSTTCNPVSQSLSSTETGTTGPQTSTSVASTQTSKSMPNLCKFVFTGGKTVAVDRYGFIADEDRKFELRLPPSHAQPDSRNTTTLRALLSERDTALPPFDYPQKLKVAVALSVSILHLFDTPWLSRVVTLDDVLFFHEGNAQPLSSATQSVYQPFVMRTLDGKATTLRQGSTIHDMPRPVNLAVLSLGAILIQVIIGRVVDALDMTGCMDIKAIYSKQEFGALLSSEVLENGGMNYDTVVKWCLESGLGVAQLKDETFCHRFYDAVVAKLKEDVELTASG